VFISFSEKALSSNHLTHVVNKKYFYSLKDSSKKTVIDSVKGAIRDTLNTTDDLKSKVKYTAKDSIIFDVAGQNVFLYGDAEITYENINLKAAEVQINWDTHIMSAHGVKDTTGKLIGLPLFKEGPQTFKSHEIRYNFDTKKGKIANVITQEGDGFIHGETVKKDDENNFYIKTGVYTTCNLDTPHYAIAAGKLKVIQNDKIVTGPAYLVIEGIPTPLFIPFGFFPNKKGQASGILIPAIGESTLYGFSVEHGGYYFALGDKANLALTTNFYSKGNFGFNGVSAYNNRYRYHGNLNVGYSITKFGDPEIPLGYSKKNDFNIKWTHTQDPKANPGSLFSASVNAGTSSFFARNINTSAADYLTNTFQSSIQYSKTWVGKPYNFSASIHHSQNTKTKIVSVGIPELTFGVNRINPFKPKDRLGAEKWYDKIGVSYAADLRNEITAPDSVLFTKKVLSKFQTTLVQKIPISTSFKILKYFSLSPSANYNEYWYLQSYDTKWITAKKALKTDTIQGLKSARDFNLSMALSTKAYGLYQFKKSRLMAIRHVITPTIGASWRPDFSNPYWGYYQKVQIDSTGKNFAQISRFLNGPQSGKSALINFALDNNLEIKVRTNTDTGVVVKKIKIFDSFSIGSSYNVAADSLKLSVFSIAARTTLFDKITLNFGANVDPYALSAAGTRYNQLQYNKSGSLGRLTNANASAGFNFNSEARKNLSKKPIQNNLNEQELAQIKAHPEEYVDFNIPWNLVVNYSVTYLKAQPKNTIPTLAMLTAPTNLIIPPEITQAMTFTGDFKVTPKWKLGFTSGYDFINRDFTYTSINIYRDLHCWEMKINWIPFGYRQSYSFQINVKSTVLQDLKLIRKNPAAIR
jgi:hypothetical protein